MIFDFRLPICDLGAKRMNRQSWARLLGSFSDNLNSKVENLKWVGLSVIVFVLVVTGAVVQAQQPKKVHKIGVLRADSPPNLSAETFQQAMSDLGYVEGKNIFIEYRYAEGKVDRLPNLAEEL